MIDDLDRGATGFYCGKEMRKLQETIWHLFSPISQSSDGSHSQIWLSPFSPDLGLSNFHLFARLNEQLQVEKFSNSSLVTIVEGAFWTVRPIKLL